MKKAFRPIFVCFLLAFYTRFKNSKLIIWWLLSSKSKLSFGHNLMIDYYSHWFDLTIKTLIVVVQCRWYGEERGREGGREIILDQCFICRLLVVVVERWEMDSYYIIITISFKFIVYPFFDSLLFFTVQITNCIFHVCWKRGDFNSFIERQIVPFDDRQGCFVFVVMVESFWWRGILMVVGGGGGQLAAMSPLPTSSNRSSSLADSHKLFFNSFFSCFFN